jgi:hypothetical protein
MPVGMEIRFIFIVKSPFAFEINNYAPNEVGDSGTNLASKATAGGSD